MLGHRLRRRPDIKTTLGQRLVFAGAVCDIESVIIAVRKAVPQQ